MDENPTTGSSSTGTVESTGTEIEGGFKEAKDTEACMENEKPIVYFFGSTSCPHCQWEKPIIKEVVSQFGDAISYHENIDSETDMDVFSKYSTGSIPTLVIGCKYYRIGSGEASGEEAEKVALKKVICMATGNLPASICE
jgi:thiol-disulfide isomerase/thioredoxin